MAEIYLVEDLEFKKKFRGLSLYKVGHTNRGVHNRVAGLQNSKNLRVLYSKYRKEYSEETKLRDELIIALNAYKPFSGWNCFGPTTHLMTRRVKNFLEKKYLPPEGTSFGKWGGGLTEYFIGRDWERVHTPIDIDEYLKSKV